MGWVVKFTFLVFVEHNVLREGRGREPHPGLTQPAKQHNNGPEK